MSQKLFAGIDISADEAVTHCLDQEGKHLDKTRCFQNNLQGASELAQYILAFEANEVHVGLEATSVYGSHMRDYLVHFYPRWFVYEINPSLVAGFKRSFPKRPKSDSFDAIAIAERLRFGQLRPFSPKQIIYQPLRQLTRHRHHLVKMVGREKTRCLNTIFLKFSNYKTDTPFKNVFGKASLAILEELSPDELADTNTEDLLAFICQNSNNRLQEPENIASELKNIANRAYRLTPKMADAVSVSLSLTLQNIAFFNSQIKKLDKLISKELNAIPQTLTTVRGIGPVYAAGIIGETGDIKRFRNEAALAQNAGLTWSRYQSGNFDAEDRHLNKNGNRYLRYYFVEAANSLRVHNEDYKAFYQKKFAEVTKHQHKRALVLTARKFVRLTFALLSKGQIYQKELMN